MHTHKNVFKGAHIGEQADVLKGAAQTGDDHVVWSGRLEYAEADQEILVPGRSNDGRRQGRDKKPEAYEDQYLDCLYGDPGSRRQIGETPHQARRQDPQQRLEPAPLRRGNDSLP